MLFLNSSDIFKIKTYLVFKKMLMILRQSTKHAYFWLGEQYPLKGEKCSNWTRITELVLVMMILIFSCIHCKINCKWLKSILAKSRWKWALAEKQNLWSSIIPWSYTVLISIISGSLRFRFHFNEPKQMHWLKIKT